MSTDPLLKALADGDTRCPDGAALSRLGRLVRSIPAPVTDLTSRVRQAPAPSLDEALPPDLARRIAALAPTPVDLRPRVRASLHHQTATRDPRRFRVWLWVGVAHAAAGLLVAVLATTQQATPTNDMVGGWGPARAAPAELPQLRDWTTLPAAGADLMADRRDPARRMALRQHYGTTRSAGAVACGLTWLAEQRPAYLTTPTDDVRLATRALAALAAAGEGDTDNARAWLEGPAPTSTVAQALDTLARVELALLSRQPQDEERARQALASLTVEEPGPGGLGGYALLATEMARAGGLGVPPRQVAAVRAALGRPLPAADADPARLGVAILARVWLGYRDNPSTSLLIPHLDLTPATPLADPLAWWFPTLALRDAGGPAWDRWNANLQAQLVTRFTDAGPGRALVPAELVRHAPDAVFATAATVLCLQAAYHSPPLAP